jgi:lysophospholipase L1-like esterase
MARIAVADKRQGGAADLQVARCSRQLGASTAGDPSKSIATKKIRQSLCGMPNSIINKKRFHPALLGKCAVYVAAIIAISNAARAGDFFIHDGDRVVFLGDSITEQSFYTNYIEAYAISRHPSWKLTFRNAGWGGDTSWLKQRSHVDDMLLFAADDETQAKMVGSSVQRGLARDVLPLRPTVVTVDFGMNDFAYQPFRPDILRAYIRSETEISRVLLANGVRPVFLTTQPIEDKRPDPDQDVRNVALRKFADALREMAGREKVEFADQFDPYMKVMLASRVSTIGGGDAVHPGPAGHTIMAWAILKALGAMPLVSTATIDGQALKVEATQACRISNLRAEGRAISFDRLDEALPMPVDPQAEPALHLVPFTHDLNAYELTVAGLPEGNYGVSIDGEIAATVSASDLAQGWNLAYAGGPITRQARELLSLVEKKNDLYNKRWRDVQLFDAPDWAVEKSNFESRRSAEMARLDAEISSLEAKIDAQRLPQTRHFTVTPAVKGDD